MWQTDSCRCLTCTGPCKLLATVVMVTAVSFYCELSPFCIAGHIWWKSTQLRFWFQKTSLLFSTLLLVEESHIVIHFLKQPKYHIFPGKPKVVSHTFWHLTGSRSNQQQSYGVIFSGSGMTPAQLSYCMLCILSIQSLSGQVYLNFQWPCYRIRGLCIYCNYACELGSSFEY